MRPDMAKVIVERPRWGSRLRNGKSRLRLRAGELAGDLNVELRSDAVKLQDKALNENLAPLRRYLERQVGRPWDKVYSEIRAHLDARKATGLHILQHLEDYVDVNCVQEGDITLTLRAGMFTRVRDLYVHPKTGLLRKAKHTKKSVAETRHAPEK